MGCCRIFLEDIDLFPFYYLNDREYKTAVGGFSTLIYVCGIFLYALYAIVPMFDPTYSSEFTVQFDTKDEHGEVYFGFVIYEGYSNPDRPAVIESLSYENCTLGNFDSSGYCISSGTPKEIYGTFGDDTYSFLEVKFVKCESESSADNTTCATEQEWEELRNQVGIIDVNIWYLDTVSYQQQTWGTSYLQIDLSFEENSISQLYFQNTLVQTESQWPWEQPTDDKYTSFHLKELSTAPFEDKMFTQYLRVSDNIRQEVRSTFTLLDFFSEVGGFFSILTSMFAAWMLTYTQFAHTRSKYFSQDKCTNPACKDKSSPPTAKGRCSACGRKRILPHKKQRGKNSSDNNGSEVELPRFQSVNRAAHEGETDCFDNLDPTARTAPSMNRVDQIVDISNFITEKETEGQDKDVWDQSGNRAQRSEGQRDRNRDRDRERKRIRRTDRDRERDRDRDRDRDRSRYRDRDRDYRGRSRGRTEHVSPRRYYDDDRDADRRYRDRQSNRSKSRPRSRSGGEGLNKSSRV